MPACYNELKIVNKGLINGYNIRLKNYEEGVKTMKAINSIIQRASRLRGEIRPKKEETLMFFYSWAALFKRYQRRQGSH